MPGERWPDKRARAVLYAGANKLAREQQGIDPDKAADIGLAVRELLFVDDEVREENANPKEHTIGYSADCMQYALLAPHPQGAVVSLWVGPENVPEITANLDAEPDTNPFRKLYGWVRVSVNGPERIAAITPWIHHARTHAAHVKASQTTSTM